MNATSNTNILYQNIIANSFTKHFPESHFQFGKMCLGDGFIASFVLGKDKTEWANGIIYNDPLAMGCMYYADHNEFEFTAFLTVKPGNPQFFSATARLTNKKKFTRETLTSENVDNYFEKVKQSILNLESQWHDKYATLIRAKLVD